MFCQHCGNQFPENANFCPTCGKLNGEENPELVNPTPTEYIPVETVNPEAEKERSQREANILEKAILGLAFGYTGLIPWLGLIFTIIARKMIAAYVRDYGETRGRVTVAKGLSIGGLASSIFYMAFWTLFISIYFFAFVVIIISQIIAGA